MKKEYSIIKERMSTFIVKIEKKKDADLQRSMYKGF